ncbi:MAG: hypothetical protein ACRYFZ_19425 [Janthinobacterium lividum]
MRRFIQKSNILDLIKWEGVGTESTVAIYLAFGASNFSINEHSNVLYIHSGSGHVEPVVPGDYIFQGSLGYDFSDKKPVRVLSAEEVEKLFVELTASFLSDESAV